MTDPATLPNPFTPGTGLYPPVLAGRDAEQTALLDGLSRIAHPSRGGPANMLLLSAPRGMGKTVLLDWLREEAETRGVAVANLIAGGVGDLLALGGALWPESKTEPARLTRVQAGPLAAQWQPGQTNQALSHLQNNLTERLLSTTLGRPLLIQVDEAHTLAAEVANALCNIAQSLTRARRPVWLILAGTPGLHGHLMSSDVEASFVERADVLSPGCLDQRAAVKALDIADWRDWTVAPAALEQAAERSQGFPFFLQRWGHALWNAGKASRTLTVDTVALVQPEVESARRDFYARRYREIHDHDDPRLVGAAVALASALSAGESLSLDEVTSAIKRAIPEHTEAVRARKHLESVGFIYMKGGEFAGGIPSLLNYVIETAA